MLTDIKSFNKSFLNLSKNADYSTLDIQDINDSIKTIERIEELTSRLNLVKNNVNKINDFQKSNPDRPKAKQEIKNKSRLGLGGSNKNIRNKDLED